VIGGTVNKEGALLIKATKVGSDTFLAQVVKLVEDAMGRKPPMQRMVDRVAGYFAFIVMALALGTFIAWYFSGSAGEHLIASALIPAVAVLVVACPCALGLATPTAVMVGMSKGAQNGVVFKGGDALELLGRIEVAIFDKTGTLTQGRPEVTDVIALEQIEISPNGRSLGSTDDSMLELAAVAEKNSEHPLAKSIVRKAADLGLVIGNVSEFFAVPGKGVKALYNGSSIIVGSAGLMRSEGIDVNNALESVTQFEQQGKTVVMVSVDKDLSGIIALLDTPKSNAKQVVQTLRKMSIEVVMLTGDNERTASTVGKELGIERIVANVLPSEKVEVIKSIQNESKKVAMIGDGINDAPALSQADMGIAIGSGTDIALEAGQVVLVRDDLRDVVAAIEISRKTISKIRQNLLYAFVYNMVLIPVAGLGLLYPALAGLAMAASSVSVTSSSLLMKRWFPPSKKQ
jgi:Cu+-exporting ATPase